MTERRRHLLLTLLLALPLGCGAREPGVSTVRLGLTGVPERIESITLLVLRADRVVASATITPPRTDFELGVPAEVPLEFRVLARTGQPAPRGLGKMPAYVGALSRSIPLSSEAARLSVTVHPAGVLSVDAALDPTLLDVVPVLIEPLDTDDPPTHLALSAASPRATQILRQGRYRASVEPDPGGALTAALTTPGPIVIVPETETLWPVGLTPVSLGDDRLGEVQLRLLGVAAGPDLLLGGGPRVLGLGLTSSTASGQRFEDPDARTRFVVQADPPSVLDPPSARVELDPNSPRLTLVAPGRLWITGELRPSAGRGVPARSSLALNVLAAPRAPTRPVRALVEIAEPEQLTLGAALRIAVLDAEGLFARAEPVRVAVTRRSPWIGLDTEAFTLRDGASTRAIVRSSNPVDTVGVLELSFTSTAAGLAANARLEIAPLAR